MAATLDPEPLDHDAAGLPFSARYGDRYASRAGALGQARHVFLAGNHLPGRWAGRRQFVILETGFGLGHNFLATWQAWRADPARPAHLHYVAVEKHPLGAEDIAGAGMRYAAAADAPDDAEHANLRATLAAQWPALVAGLHRIEFESGRVLLTVAWGDAREVVAQLVLGADAFYLDGFAPERNPQMWEPGLLRSLARLARPQATLATYTAAGTVREALRANGFVVERVAGFGLKRHMLRAQFVPRWKLRRHEPPLPDTGPRQALIVGAGLAGCCVARALVRRGWQVTVLEGGATPPGGASALPAGLVYPLLSADDNLASRLSRAAFDFAGKALASLAPPPTEVPGQDSTGNEAPGVAPLWSPCGVFQQAASAAEEKVLRERLRRDGWPESFVRFEDAATAARHLGMRPRHGGAWFAQGMVVDGGRWCRALLAQAHAEAVGAGGSLQLVCGCTVAHLERDANFWQLTDLNGTTHTAPVVVLANAAGLEPLLHLQHLPLHNVAGCLSLVDAAPLEKLRAAVGGDGYVVPGLLGRAAIGATYELVNGGITPQALQNPEPLQDPQPPQVPEQRHVPQPVAALHATQPAGPVSGPARPLSAASAANLRRLEQLLHEAPHPAVMGEFRGLRCMAQDRMPVVGAVADETQVLQRRAQFAGAQLADLPRQDGLYCLAALGSRGLTLAPLLGELLAARMAGEPAPVDAALCAALDPGRFLLRHLRTGGNGSAGPAAPAETGDGEEGIR